MESLKKGTKTYMEYEESSDFIIHDMNFYSWEDFLIRARVLKARYLSSNLLTKQIYLWYVYSRTLSNKQKNGAWSYLNNCLSFKNLTKL